MYRKTMIVAPRVFYKLSTSIIASKTKPSHRTFSSVSNKNGYRADLKVHITLNNVQINPVPSVLHDRLHSQPNRRQSDSSPQRRFYSKDTNLRQGEEDLTEEELKVLEELEREEAEFKAQLDKEGSQTESAKLRQSVAQEFVPFENQQRVIQDVIDQIWNPLPTPEKLVYEPPEEFLTRGKTGVFDLGELVDLLREENAIEVVAITMPKEIDYADQMVIVTARNPRHLLALGTYVRKRYKMKHLKPSDVLPKIISEDSKQGWIALDLGNIILHIFLQEVRDFYDLELLWTVGPLFDDLYNAQDPEIIRMLNLMT